jgi:GNAT superfamily N-acetyltransferase
VEGLRDSADARYCRDDAKRWIIPRTSRKGSLLVAITFRFHYPIERTMAFEREYHPNLRLTLPEKRELLKSAITIWMLEDGKLVGETYGVAWGAKEEMPEFPRDPDAVYCYSNTILKNYQSKGYGAILKAAFIGRVSRDFKRIYGHARPGASQALNKKFGARMGKTYKNWFGTGEDYRVYVLPLGK